MRGNADGARLVRDAALDGLPDPPGCVGRELEPAAPVELLHGADQADHALLDKVEQCNAVSLITLRYGHDEAQVGVDHVVLRLLVSALDALRERDLLVRG